MIERIWILCKPSVKDAVNDSLRDIAGGDVVVCQLPGATSFDEPLPPAKVYVSGWQDDSSVLDQVRGILSGMSDVVVVPGMSWGIEEDEAGECLPTNGDDTTKRARECAISYGCMRLGVNL